MLENQDIFLPDPPSLFSDEDKIEDVLQFNTTENSTVARTDTWKILIVDDELDVHIVTGIVLNNFLFQDKKVQLLNAYSATDAIEVIKANPDIAMILLDVVMEESDSGLKLVKIIREEILCPFVRIILRTGQPGMAPEAEVITKYDINDYQTKTDLTHERLLTIVTSALRAYNSLVVLEGFRQNLDEMVRKRTQELQIANEKLVQQNIEIEAQKNELKQSNALKDKMFSIIAHDLRGPIGNFMVLPDLLAQQDGESNQQILKLVRQAANSTYFLLENLLLWSRSQCKTVVCSPCFNSLEDTLDNVVDLLFPFALSKEIRINNNIQKNLQAYYDTNTIDTVFRNIVSNAIKFSPQSSVITISATESNDEVTVCVQDEGVGMSPENVEVIFNKYQHYTTHGTANEKGSGLGINLCVEFVEMNKGKIRCESEEGKGTKFYVSLPKQEV